MLYYKSGRSLRMFLMSAKIEILNWIENEKHEIILFLQEFIQAASPNHPETQQ